MLVILSESQFNKSLLYESQHSKSVSAAKKLIMNELHCSYDDATNYLVNRIISSIPNLRDERCQKFILGVTRIFINGELNDSDFSFINSLVRLLSNEKYYNSFDRNLNGMNRFDLLMRFENEIKDSLQYEKNELDNIEYASNNEYNIIKIDSFEQCKPYYRYSYNKSPWCVTYLEGQYDSYTCNGLYQLYFCLKNGFENIEPNIGNNYPLDEYGLSMFSVIVNELGQLVYCTTRWNHFNKATDNAMNAKQISELIGKNFFDVFKPNNKWNETIEKSLEEINNGAYLEDVFDSVVDGGYGYRIVELNGKYNYLTSNNTFLFTDKWFELCKPFNNGYSIISLYRKYNLINTEGKFVSEEWYDEIYSYYNGFARVYIKGKGWNFINMDGKLLNGNVWYRYCNNFNCGLAAVKNPKGKWNYINIDGSLLYENQWFDECKDFKNDVGIICYNKQYTYIDVNGRPIFNNVWFEYCDHFSNGFAVVKVFDNGYNFINTRCELLTPNMWYDKCSSFVEGFARVIKDGKFYFVGTDGNILGNLGFDLCGDFHNGYAIITYDEKGSNYIGTDGKILSRIWFDECYNFVKNYAMVELDGDELYIDRKGSLHKYINRNINIT